MHVIVVARWHPDLRDKHVEELLRVGAPGNRLLRDAAVDERLQFERVLADLFKQPGAEPRVSSTPSVDRLAPHLQPFRDHTVSGRDPILKTGFIGAQQAEMHGFRDEGGILWNGSRRRATL